MKSSEYGFEEQHFYSKGLDYEGLLNQQIARISHFRSSRMIENYFASVDTLIMMMPRTLRDKAIKFKTEEGINFSLSKKGIAGYDRLYKFCNCLLEEHNLIFKTKFVKTYS